MRKLASALSRGKKPSSSDGSQDETLIGAFSLVLAAAVLVTSSDAKHIKQRRASAQLSQSNIFRSASQPASAISVAGPATIHIQT
jgi:hypothetical protein